MASITFATEGSVAVVTIERPEVRNAVDRPTAAELVEAFRRFDADPALDAAVLTGAGGNFCAGADLKGVAEGRGNQVTEDGEGSMGPTRMRLDKPVIAAVEGYAVAGGVRPRSDRAAVLEDFSYGQAHPAYPLWPSLTMPVLLLRAGREILPGTGYIVSQGDRERFPREVPGARVADVDANHYTVVTTEASATAIRQFFGRQQSQPPR